MDRLTKFLKQFPVSASVIHSGAYSGKHGFPTAGDSNVACGHLHVVRQGEFLLSLAERRAVSITKPTVIYIPNSLRHILQSVDGDTSREVLCATVQLGDITHDQITKNLPDMMLVPLARAPALDTAISLLFDESCSELSGKQIAQDNLLQYFLVLVLRELIENNAVNIGVLAGLADKRLAKVLTAVQDEPAREWSLEIMASTAGMSRSRFAEHFKTVLGMTPHQYVTDWRITLVKTRLRRGENFNKFAQELGYSHSTALIRAFQQQTGLTPIAWAKQADKT